MNRPSVALALFAITAFASAACSSNGSATDEATEESVGALRTGEKVTCTPVELSEARVDYRGDVYDVKKIVFTPKEDDTVQLKVERASEDGDALDPIVETTPSFTQTDRTLRASAKRDVMLKAGKSQSSDPRYVGFVTVKDHTFAVECEVQGSARAPRCRTGATRPDVDGCNTCTCNGSYWACTELFCAPPPPPPGRGSRCTAGASRPAGDGCNTCTCNGNSWACTELACGPRPGSGGGANRCVEGQSRPDSDGCNTCSCSGGHWACTELFCGR